MSVVTHMDRGFASYAKPTYQDLDAACRHISDFIHYNATKIGKTELIVGLTRGGLMPAVILSHTLNIPMVAVQYSSKIGNGDKAHLNVLPELNAHSILLVDDICDSGETLNEVTSHYKHEGYDVSSAVIYYKDLGEKIIYEPDVWAIKISQNFGWVTFDWER